MRLAPSTTAAVFARSAPVAMAVACSLALPAVAGDFDQVGGAPPRMTAQCLVRGIGDGAQRTSLAVIVPQAQSLALIKKGFVAAPCETAFATARSAEDWRNRICSMAANPNEAVQNQLEAHLGERPNVLCGMAEQVIGPWLTK